MPDDDADTQDWLRETSTMEYRLEAWGSFADEPEQRIDLTEDEYTALKQSLAGLRGMIPFGAAAG